jgi:hypothetical protein
VCFLRVRPHHGTTLRRALPLSADSRYASAVALLVADGDSVEPAILLDREHLQRTRRNQGARTGCHTGQSGRSCGCRISRQWRMFREVANYCLGVQVIRVRHRPIDNIRFYFRRVLLHSTIRSTKCDVLYVLRGFGQPSRLCKLL